MAAVDPVTQALAYIKGISERYRTEAQILQLNRTIDRLDVEKDAKTGSLAEGNMVETRAPYTTAMTALFPGISATNPLVQLGKIEHDIFDALVLGPLGKQHSWLKKQGKGYSSSFMPVHVTNTYHDSGYNPKEIIADYTAWITPGSYIDPAGRDKPYMARTDKFPANGQPIRIPLDVFGFPGIVFEATMNADNSCEVRININGIIVNITRNQEFLSVPTVPPSPDYFSGNPEKNRAINGQPNNANGIAEVKKYAISKELSDFLQILFGIINMIRLFAQGQQLYTHCMFTTDNVVSARSKLMGLQSCVQDHSITEDKSSHRVILHLAQMDPAAAARELRITYLNACLKNNNTIKAHIARAIIQGLYIDPQNRIAVAGEIRDYLQDILAAIDIGTTQAEALALDGDEDTDVYKKRILKYYAKTPINEKGRVAQSLQRLFVNCDELRPHDPIHNRRRTFGQEIVRLTAPAPAPGRRAPRKTRKFLNLRKMRGGARLINPHIVVPDAILNTLFADETEPWNGSVVPIMEGSLLNHMLIIINPGSLAEFEDFIFRAFNHLLYICETPLDDRLLSIYRNIDRIEELSLEDFYADYINPAFRNAAFCAEARGRLIAARAVDPMKMLDDKAPTLTIDEINAGIEALRAEGGIAPGVEAPAVDMEVDAQAPVPAAAAPAPAAPAAPAAPPQAPAEDLNNENDGDDAAIETDDEGPPALEPVPIPAQKAQKAQKEQKLKQSPKHGSNKNAALKRRFEKSIKIRNKAKNLDVMRRRLGLPPRVMAPVAIAPAAIAMRKTRKLRRK